MQTASITSRGGKKAAFNVLKIPWTVPLGFSCISMHVLRMWLQKASSLLNPQMSRSFRKRVLVQLSKLYLHREQSTVGLDLTTKCIQWLQWLQSKNVALRMCVPISDWNLSSAFTNEHVVMVCHRVITTASKFCFESMTTRLLQKGAVSKSSADGWLITETLFTFC